MSNATKQFRVIVASALLTIAAQGHSFAGSARWIKNPASGDWNAIENWMPRTVPNGAGDVATFSRSNVTSVSIEGAAVEVSNIVFKSDAAPYSISVESTGALLITGSGILNNSGVVQSFVTPPSGDDSAVIFFINATAGEMTSFGGQGGEFIFEGSASAGSASFDVSSGAVSPGTVEFVDTSTASEAQITLSDFGGATFGDTATAANAVIAALTGGHVTFGTNSTADHAVATLSGAPFIGSEVGFTQTATAAQGTFTANGAITSGDVGANINFSDTTTAAEATFIINGGTAQDAPGAVMTFFDSSTAANVTITVNGGTSGGKGGAIFFQGNSLGGNAAISVFGNGELDISNRVAPGVTIGSLTGDGRVFLGSNTLTLGSNNQSTTFSGVIQESGSLAKIGAGTLTLTGRSTYTGTTAVDGGVLNAGNKTGSATGTGAVKVNAGTLGGKGIIAGATTIGSGSGVGAFLAPAVGTGKQTTLTLQGALTLNSDATYTYTFKAKKNQARTDLVKAHGVAIGGATLSLSGQIEGRLRRGLTLTVINNTSTNPINGTFTNLPEGAIVNVNGNNLQANYHGGDSNDLTLTVVR